MDSRLGGGRTKHLENRRRNWQSFFPHFIPLPIPVSTFNPSSSMYRQRRGTFPWRFLRAPSRAIAPFISLTSELPFDHRLLLFPRGSRLSKYFVIPENGVSQKETDFTPERALYARLSSIFLFLAACSQICRNLNALNWSLFLEGKHHEHCFLFSQKRMKSSLIQEHEKAPEDFQLNTRTSILNYSRLFSKWMYYKLKCFNAFSFGYRSCQFLLKPSE